jgi:hypothetical protein
VASLPAPVHTVRVKRATTLLARSFLISLAVFACAAWATEDVQAESATLSIDRVTTLNFMRAATPFTFEIVAAGFTERFTLFNPRELRFEAGKVRLKVDCRGEPMSVNAELEPTLVVYFDQYIQPFVLPVSFSQTLDQGIPGLTIDYLIRDLRVLDEKIEAKADLVFRKQPPRPAASSGK